MPGSELPSKAVDPMGQTTGSPPKAGIILATLIIGAAVANINLAIANVALPSVGRELGASQAQLTMVASTFTMTLAASVLYLGAVGDRYGRKMLLLCGAGLSIPVSVLAAWAPNVEVLIGARALGGIAAGMLFPTTLSLIGALWRGSAQTKAIALWSGLGGAAVTVGTLIGGALLASFWWGSVFLFTAPLALVVFIGAFVFLPWNAGEEKRPVDHLGGVLSVIAVAALISGIQRLPNGWDSGLTILSVVALAAFVLFFLRQRRAPRPLVDLKLASAPSFWVAVVAGMIGFGSLVGALFLGGQFTQLVLSYSPLAGAAAGIPMAVTLVIFSAIGARMIASRGSRATLAIGMATIGAGFLWMIIFWTATASVFHVLFAYGVLGCGVGLSAAVATRSVVASLPVTRTGMASAFTDLMRDFGGALMQAVMGTVLAIVYSDNLVKVIAKLTPAQSAALGDQAAKQITSSAEGAQLVAEHYPPEVANEILKAAGAAFTQGKGFAYGLALALVVVAVILVLWKYPARVAEEKYLAEIAELSKREVEEYEATAPAKPA